MRKANAPVVASPSVSALDIPIRRARLRNGLRVVLSPDASAPTVAVAVYYDVGFRSEPEGRTGFAHLFEHMMFQGSEHVPKMQHAALVQGNGGSMNGTTTPDYTNYFESLPATALELGLFLEADRMRSIQLTEENLANQIEVVKEEVRLNVLNRPYGGFPWIHLPGVMFDTFANAHNGYGSFVDLESATLDDATDFYRRYYAPGNAVLCVVGDFDPVAARRVVRRHFGDIPAGDVPERPSFAEPLPPAARRARHEDGHAPTPAVAIGYRVPSPQERPRTMVALEVLGELVAGSEASPLTRRLVRDAGLATAVAGWLGTFPGAGLPFERDPTRFQFLVHYAEPAALEPIVAAVGEELAAIAAGAGDGEVAAAVNVVLAGYLQRVDGFLSRALTLAPFELLYGRAELVNELPGMLAAVDAAAVSDAARTLLAAPAAILELTTA